MRASLMTASACGHQHPSRHTSKQTPSSSFTPRHCKRSYALSFKGSTQITTWIFLTLESNSFPPAALFDVGDNLERGQKQRGGEKGGGAHKFITFRCPTNLPGFFRDAVCFPSCSTTVNLQQLSIKAIFLKTFVNSSR